MIRLISQQDIPQVNELYYLLFEQMAEIEPFYFKASYQKEEFLQTVVTQKEGFVGYVYEKDKKIIGFVIAQLQQAPPYECFKSLKCAYMMDIVVNAQYRGHGIGKKLIEEIKKWSMDNKADYLELNVLAKNKNAYNLYLRENFVPYTISMRIKF